MDCSQMIVSRISTAQDLDTLQERMNQYLEEYTGKCLFEFKTFLILVIVVEYQKKFGNLKNEEGNLKKVNKDNKTLKRAVRILYDKLKKRTQFDNKPNQSSDIKQQVLNNNLINQNQQLQKLLSSKDNEILKLK